MRVLKFIFFLILALGSIYSLIEYNMFKYVHTDVYMYIFAFANYTGLTMIAIYFIDYLRLKNQFNKLSIFIITIWYLSIIAITFLSRPIHSVYIEAYLTSMFVFISPLIYYIVIHNASNRLIRTLVSPISILWIGVKIMFALLSLIGDGDSSVDILGTKGDSNFEDDKYNELIKSGKTPRFTEGHLRNAYIRDGKYLIDSYGKEHIIFNYDYRDGSFEDFDGFKYTSN